MGDRPCLLDNWIKNSLERIPEEMDESSGENDIRAKVLAREEEDAGGSY